MRARAWRVARGAEGGGCGACGWAWHGVVWRGVVCATTHCFHRLVSELRVGLEPSIQLGSVTCDHREHFSLRQEQTARPSHAAGARVGGGGGGGRGGGGGGGGGG